MRWAKAMLAAALAVAIAPAVATGAPRADAARIDKARTAWEHERARLAKHLPLTSRYAEAVATPLPRDVLTFEDSWLDVAGDLDRNGGDDFVDVHDHGEYDDTLGTFTEALTLYAHRGSDGKTMWSVSVPKSNYVYAIYTATGAKGTPGVVVVSYSGAGAGALVAGGGQAETTVTAYDGAGKTVWTKAFHGAGSDTLVHSAWASTEVGGFLDAVKGGGTDVLVATSESLSAYDPTYTAGAGRTVSQLGIIDGSTGTERDLGAAVVSDETWTFAVPLGDLDHDHLDDVGLLSGTAGTPTLTAMRSTDGKALWTARSSGGADWWAARIADVTGDGTSDVYVESYPYTSSGEQIVLVDGKTGAVRWSRPGSRAIAIGDADRRRGSEVVVGTGLSGSRRGFTAAAYTASGRRLWSVTRGIDTTHVKQPYASRASWGAIGDTNLDGVAEIGYGVDVTPQGAKAKHDDGTVDGRTGKVRRDEVKDMYATSVAIDGRGSDSYTRTTAHGLLTVTAWRGDGTGRIWSMTTKAAGTAFGSFGVRADRDRCGDLMVAVDAGSAGRTDILISGATGKPVWSLTRASGPGTVAHPRARSLRRFAGGHC
jgi:hypothetical protein